MKRLSAFVSIILACCVSYAAQWPKYQERGVPRDAQGRMSVDGPAPKAADGKPDFSGDWVRADREPPPAELSGILNTPATPGIPVEPPTSPFPPSPNSPPVASFWDIGTNLPGGTPLTPWAAELKKNRMATNSRDNPDANCLPMGPTQFHMQPQPRKIVQTPTLIVILYEANYGTRLIYTDGRALPPQGEPQPWWYGYSIGRWEGDTLVVETNNVRGAESGPFDGWLDVRGSPYSDQAKFVERFRRPIFGKLEIDVTVEDAKSYTKPITVRINQRFLPDEEPIEAVCNENQQFRQRIKIE